MKKVFLLFIAILIIPVNLFAAEITLAENADLHPQGWIAGSATFKAGTKVVLNKNGEVVSGVLTGYGQFLPPAGWALVYHPMTTAISKPGTIWYRGDISPVLFSMQGKVLSGTLAEKASVKLDGKSLPLVEMEIGTVLTFREDGSVLAGALANDTYLRPVGWESLSVNDEIPCFIKFKRAEPIIFNEKGTVTSGTIAEKTKIGKMTYDSNTKLAFTETGFVTISK